MDLITPKVAASILFVHPETLRRYEQEGELSEHKTPGGHRRYSREEIEELKELIAAGGKPSSNKGKTEVETTEDIFKNRFCSLGYSRIPE